MSPEVLHTNGCFGCDSLGRLTRVMVHRPGEELKIINGSNHRDWLFDTVPDVIEFRDEHDAYCELLRSHSVEVLELADYIANAPAKLANRPNITYMHDIAVISKHGALLSAMAWAGRRDEHLIVREALENLSIPIFSAFDEPQDAFEGCLLLSPRTVLVAETERHNPSSIRKFIARALFAFDEVIYVKIPKARRFMHPDTVYNRVTDRLALVYLPAIQAAYLCRRDAVEPVDFAALMRARGIEMINVSDTEQQRLACSFHYDTALDPPTRRQLSRRGVEIVPFHPHALHAGGGSLRCLTLRLHRTTGPEMTDDR
jgi:arginine deiminase